MNGVGAAQLRRGDLAQPQVAHLSRVDQLAQRADGLLDGGVRVGTVHVVEVDGLDAQTPQRCVTGRAHVLRPAAGARLVRVHHSDGPGDPKLGGDLQLVSVPGDEWGEHLLVRAGGAGGIRLRFAVDVGGVEEGDPGVEGLLKGLAGLVVGGAAVDMAERHAPESDG